MVLKVRNGFGWGALQGERPRFPRVNAVRMRQPSEHPKGVNARISQGSAVEAAQDPHTN
jgi:hypothetical protein